MKRRAKRLPRRQKKKTPFRSKFEDTVAFALLDAGVTFSYETLKLSYSRPCTYTPDFILPNGVVLEVKGFWPPSDRTKHKLVKEAHPDVDIRFVFQNAFNTLSKSSKTTYADWCDKHGILWCHRKIPEEWLKKAI